MKYAVLLCRLVIAFIFLLSSIGKLVDIRQYSIAAVIDFDILPDTLAYIVGSAVPFIELLCALGLALGILTRLSAIGIALMSISFFIVKLILLSNGSDINCGCFGAITTTLISETVYMDPPIFGMALVVALSSSVNRHFFSLRDKFSLRPDRLRLVW